MNEKAADFASPPSGLRTRFLQGIIWNVAGAVCTQGAVFLSNILVANILGKSVFGEFGMVQNTLLSVAGLAQMATGMTATKYIAEFRLTNKLKTGRVLGLCASLSFITALVATIGIVLVAPWLASALFKAPHLSQGIIISSGVIFFSVITGFQIGALAGLEGYAGIARASMIQGIFHISICGIFAWLWKLEGVLGGLAISSCLRCFLFNRVLKMECASQNISVNYRDGFTERRIITRFAIPAAAIGFLSMPAAWLSHVLLVRQAEGYAYMGIFSAAYSLRTMIIFLPNLMNNVGMSLLNNQRGSESGRNYKKIFLMNMALTQSVVLISSLIVMLLGPWLLRAFGKDFTEGYTVLRILVFSAIAESFVMAIYQIIQSQERMWLSFFFINAPLNLALLASAYYYVPTYNATGLAFAYVIAWCVAALTTVLQVWRIGIWGKRKIY